MTAYLAVARYIKPHGLKGDGIFFPLTDDPEVVFCTGRELTPIDESGAVTGPPVVIERSRSYHRRWLIKLQGIERRESLEGWGQRVFGVAQDELEPPGDGEMYVHEIPGCRVIVDGEQVGTARRLIEVPAGDLLEIEVGGREVLVPFKAPILVGLDRDARTIELDPPEGLLDL